MILRKKHRRARMLLALALLAFCLLQGVARAATLQYQIPNTHCSLWVKSLYFPYGSGVASVMDNSYISCAAGYDVNDKYIRITFQYANFAWYTYSDSGYVYSNGNPWGFAYGAGCGSGSYIRAYVYGHVAGSHVVSGPSDNVLTCP